MANCWCAHERVILVFIVYKKRNTKITLEWAHKQFVTRVHTLLYFLPDKTNPKMTLKRGSSHITPVSHSLALHSADDVTIDWRWRHNDHCDADTWQVISNPLDIDFIHGDIHGGRVRKPNIPWENELRYVLGYYRKIWLCQQSHDIVDKMRNMECLHNSPVLHPCN